MWWGGGTDTSPTDPGIHGGDPELDDTSSPIPIRGGGRLDDSSSPLSSSMASSVGSPSTDLQELRNLRSQFHDQEELLGQIREALQGTAQRQETQDYASRLAQMRQKGRTGGPDKKVSSTPIKQDINTDFSEAGSGGKKTRGAKMQMLRKQLEESKARQNAEAESRKDLESMVHNLQQEIAKRDTVIASLQLSSVNSSVISSPFVMSPESGQSPASYSPGSITPPYKSLGGVSHSDMMEQISAKDNKIIELSEQVADLGRKVFDLEENLKEKDQIITARTQAVGLAAASVSARGREHLEQLDTAREQLRSLQQQWSSREAEWRSEKEEKDLALEASRVRVEAINLERNQLIQTQSELEQKGKELRDEVGQMGEQVAEAKNKAREERILLEARVEELEEDKTKLEHTLVEKEHIFKARINELEKQLRESRLDANEDKELAERVAELEISSALKEEEKGNLQLKIMELEEAINTESRLKTDLAEVKEELRHREDDIEAQTRSIAMLESEKFDLMEAIASRDDMLTSRLEEIGRISQELEEASCQRVRLEMRCVELEEAKDRWEGERLEAEQRLQAEKEMSAEALKPLEELQTKYDELKKEHENFKSIHQEALNKSKLYDTDILDKYTKIKELKIERDSLHSMLADKNQLLSAHFSDMEAKDAEITKLSNDKNNLEIALKAKEEELANLQTIVSNSDNVQVLTDLHETVKQLNSNLDSTQKDLADKVLLIEQIEAAKNTLEDQLSATEKVSEERLKMNEELSAAMNDLEEKLGKSDSECLTFKEKLNNLLEQTEIEKKKQAEDIEKLKVKLQETEQKLSEEMKVNKDMKEESLELNKKMESLTVDFEGKIESLNADNSAKNGKIDKLLKDLDDINSEMDSKFKALEEEKAKMQQSHDSLKETLEEKLSELRDMEQVLNLKNDEVKTLETDLNLKIDDLKILNEDMTSKYKIIEDLQSQVMTAEDSLEIEKEAKGKVSALLKEKEAALDTLQTVIDALKAENGEKSSNELASLQEKLLECQRSLTEKNVLLEQHKVDEESEKMHNTELTDRIVQLEKEMSDYSGFTEYMNILKAENKNLIEASQQKDAEMKSLKDDLERLNQVKSDGDKSTGDSDEMVRLQEEQIQMLRYQLKEKAELIDRLTDQPGLDAVQQLNEELESKSQEIDDLKNLLRKAEVDKNGIEEARAKLENKLSELEQFNLEMVKESNHVEETGEKLRELRNQIEQKNDELSSLEAENKQLKQNINNQSQVGSASEVESNLVAERDALKEKNEKLKDMCKKYLAKVKLLEGKSRASVASVSSIGNTSVMDNQREEELSNKILQLETQVKQLTKDFTVAEEKNKSSEIKLQEIHAELENSISTINSLTQELTEKESAISSKDDILQNKDDIIRDLKAKLEAAPENVPVDPEDEQSVLAAHNQTKAELNALKEKCKKLIVKVKQQDALLKKEYAKVKTESTSSMDDNHQKLAEKEKELKKEREKITKIEQEFEQVKLKMETVATENEDLKKRLVESESAASEAQANSEEIEELNNQVDELEDKVDNLTEENKTLTSAKAQMEAELLKLRMEKNQATAFAEKLQKEKKTNLEQKIISGLYNSPLLEAARLAEPQDDSDDDDGRADTPEIRVQQETGFKGFEDDGWGASETAANIVGTSAASVEPEGASNAAVEPVALEKDGWGEAIIEDDGLVTPDPGSRQQQLVPDQAAEAQATADEDGWGVENQGDGWEDDWGSGAGEPEIPSVNVSEQPLSLTSNASNVTTEREADIEDGWGDDTWGEPEIGGGLGVGANDDLAANLRLSVDRDMADVGAGAASSVHSSVHGTPTRQIVKSPSHEAMEYKMAEKESELENLQSRFDRLVEAKCELESHVKNASAENNELLAKLNKLSNSEANMKATIESLEEKINILETERKVHAQEIEGENDELRKLREQIEAMKEIQIELNNMRTSKTELETRLESATSNHTDLEEKVSALESEKSAFELEQAKLNAELTEMRESKSKLSTDLAQLQEDLESSENTRSDLQETIKQLQQRRNSQDSKVEELEAMLANMRSENEEQDDKLSATQMAEAQVNELKAEIKQIQEEMDQKSSKLQSQSNRVTELEAEVSSLKSDVEAARISEDEMGQELAGKSAHLQQYQHQYTSLDTERNRLLEEVTTLRNLVSEMSVEKESVEQGLQVQLEAIQVELATVQTAREQDQHRIQQLQEEINNLREPGDGQVQPMHHPAPPPDVTNRGGGSQPDVARRGGPNPPDIMPPGGRQPRGQLDLVNAPPLVGAAANQQADNAASWFDNFDAGGQDGWGDDDGWGIQDNLVLGEQQPNQDVGIIGQHPPVHDNPVQAGNQDLESLLQESRAETGRLQATISELEGRYSILEREKVVLEQSQTQLLADYKTLYEQSSSYQDQLNAQSEQGDQSAVIEQLQQQLTQQGSSHQAVVEELQQQLTMSRQQEEYHALEMQTYQGQISDLTNQMYQLRTASVQVTALEERIVILTKQIEDLTFENNNLNKQIEARPCQPQINQIQTSASPFDAIVPSAVPIANASPSPFDEIQPVAPPTANPLASFFDSPSVGQPFDIAAPVSQPFDVGAPIAAQSVDQAFGGTSAADNIPAPSEFFNEPVASAPTIEASTVATSTEVDSNKEELEAKIQENEARIQELEVELADKASQLTQTKSTLDVYKSNLVGMETKIGKLETALAEKKEELSKSNHMLEAYKEKVSALENCATNMSGEISNINEQNKSELESEKLRLQGQIDALSASLDEKNEFIEELKSTIEQKESENDQLNKDLELLSNQVGVLENKIPQIKVSEDNKNEEAPDADKTKETEYEVATESVMIEKSQDASQLFSGNVMTPNQPIDGASQFFTSTAVKPDNASHPEPGPFDQGFVIESNMGQTHTLQTADQFFANPPTPTQQQPAANLFQPTAVSDASSFFNPDTSNADNANIYDPFSSYQQEQKLQEEILQDQAAAIQEDTAASFFAPTQQQPEAAAGQTAASFFSSTQQDQVAVSQANTAADFFTQPTADASQTAETITAAALFDNNAVAAATNEVAASFFSSETVETASYFATEAVTAQAPIEEAVVQQAANEQGNVDPSVSQIVDTSAVQVELANYQAAIADWQVWGQAKTEEITGLQETVATLQQTIANITDAFNTSSDALNTTSAAYTQAQDELKSLKDELERIGDAGKPDDKVNEALKLIKIKDMELEEMKVTIDRLETEKQDLYEEIRETKNEMQKLEGANDQLEAFQTTLDQLEDSKVCYDKLKEDESMLRNELAAKDQELNMLKSGLEKERNNLQQQLQEKSSSLAELQDEMSSRLQELDCCQRKLAEAEEMRTRDIQEQEEIAAEFEQMQQQVLESENKISSLTKELENLREQASKAEDLTKQLEQAKQASVAPTNEINVVPSETVTNSEAEVKITQLEAEIESYKQALVDWNVWSENKTAEYNQLLDAYNQYVDAYNTMSTEYNSLKSEHGPTTDSTTTEIDSNKIVDNKEDEIARLNKELEDKISELKTKDDIIESKEREITVKEQIIAEKESELVTKTGENAKLSIKSYLSGFLSPTKGPTDPAANELSVAKQDSINIEPNVPAVENAPPMLGTPPPMAQEGVSGVWGAIQQVGAGTTPVVPQLVEEGWGADAQEDPFAGIGGESVPIPEQVNALETEISQLRQEMTALNVAKTDAETAAGQLRQELDQLSAAKTEAETELNTAKLKNGKLLVKVKTLTKQVETLKSGKGGGNTSSMDDLDKTLEAEMKAQVLKAQGQLDEVRRDLVTVRTEKTRLEEKVDTLEAAHDRLVQMKESQDNEVSYLTSRTKELKEETEGLRWQLEEVEERSRMEVAQLTVALSAYQSAESSSSQDILNENARLKQDMSVTSSELERVQQSADKLREDLSVLGAQLRTALEEVEVWKSKAEEAREVQTSIEQQGLQEMESMKLHIESLESEKGVPSVFGGGVEHIGAGGVAGEVAQLKEKIRREQQLVLQLEMDLQMKDAALEEAREELDGLRARGESLGPAPISGTPGRLRRDSTDSRMSDTFIDQEVFLHENNKLKGDLDHALRENRRLSSRIRSWETELERGMDSNLDQEGLRAELTRAIKTLQMKEHKLEEIQDLNLTLLEERDSLQLRLSSLMRQMESAANSRAMTPVPGGGNNTLSSPGYGVLDPQTQILELNSKLSELRKLNYALDVELQKERGQRAQQHIRVMEPRSREAERMLGSSSSQPSDSPVKHL